MKNIQSPVDSHSVEDTMLAGKRLAESLLAGGVILLRGEMGAGKTHFVKGLAEGLNINERITSPTFTLANEYNVVDSVISRLVHVDLYRLKESEEIYSLDLPEKAEDPTTLLVVEWPERIVYAWPNILTEITFEQLSDSGRRLIFN